MHACIHYTYVVQQQGYDIASLEMRSEAECKSLSKRFYTSTFNNAKHNAREAKATTAYLSVVTRFPQEFLEWRTLDKDNTVLQFVIQTSFKP